jgi:uncharacterized membrane protein
MTKDGSQREIPQHVDEVVRSVAQLRSEHHGKAAPAQRAVNRITGVLARPRSIALLGLLVAVWIAANVLAGPSAVDPPPFPWLQGAAELFSVFIVMLILVAQKHDDELSAHRGTLTLELAILGEQKIAKVIQLVEELRRDSPQVQDRVDLQAEEMAQHADAQSVLTATRGE